MGKITIICLGGAGNRRIFQWGRISGVLAKSCIPQFHPHVIALAIFIQLLYTPEIPFSLVLILLSLSKNKKGDRIGVTSKLEGHIPLCDLMWKF